MNSSPGTYALVFHCEQAREVAAGRLGSLSLVPDYYLYVGSAFGPGGVKARTEHHRRIRKRPHWHLDYLRPHLQLFEIWFTYERVKREHQWAADLALLRGARMPFPGFGATDCDCVTHFYGFGYKPSFTAFRRLCERACRGIAGSSGSWWKDNSPSPCSWKNVYRVLGKPTGGFSSATYVFAVRS